MVTIGREGVYDAFAAFKRKESVMTLEKALMTALDYETKVKEVYVNLVKAVTEEPGKKVFQKLAEEEQEHIDFLKKKLREWQDKGHLTREKIESAVPAKEKIRKGIEKISKTASKRRNDYEMELLRQAYEMEEQTSAFYRKMVDEMKDDGKELFSKFLEIEDSHIAVVRAEMDYITNTGYWYDFFEISMDH